MSTPQVSRPRSVPLRQIVATSRHRECVACGGHDPLGLGLTICSRGRGVVELTFPAEKRFQGYPGCVHGGITALLFDAAMTHCLFSAGVVAVTGSLNIRYLKTVDTHGPVTVLARIIKSRSRLTVINASLQQAGECRAKAEAHFWMQQGRQGSVT